LPENLINVAERIIKFIIQLQSPYKAFSTLRENSAKYHDTEAWQSYRICCIVSIDQLAACPIEII